MEITRNEILTEDNVNYDDYYRHQLQANLDVLDTIEIKINGTLQYNYVARYGKCNISLVTQDKSVKRDPTELEKINYEIELLEKKKADEEAKETSK